MTLFGDIQTDIDKEKALRRVARWILVFAVFGLLVVSIYGKPIGGLLWSGACLFSGALVGFLFGIPKTVADPKATEQRPNTNLEDISDWMTKIIVGIGLAQMKSIPPLLLSAAGYIAFTWGGGDQNRTFGYALMLYFSVVGFLGGYLLTRIFLSPLFKTIDGQSTLSRIVLGGNPPPAPPPVAPATTIGPASTSADPAAEATGAVLSAYTDLDKKAGTGTLQLHIKRLTALKDHFPVFRMLYIVLARLYRYTDNLDQAIAVLTEYIGNKGKAGTANDADTAAAYYNRACYWVLKGRTADEAAKKPLWDNALADLGDAFKRSREYKGYAKEDPDLQDIRGSVDFAKLLATD